MKSENGISYTKLLIIFAIIIVIGIIFGTYIMGIFRGNNLEDIKTDMLLIQTKVKVLKGDSDITGDASVLKGVKLSAPEQPAEIQQFMNKGIIGQEEYDYYYVVNQEVLNEIGLSEIKLENGEYFIVNYNTYEVIYTEGYRDEYKNTYYKLTEIQDLVYSNIKKWIIDKMKEKELQRLQELKKIDNDIFSQGYEYVCGIDEAGRGPLAGPVVVASVIMPKDSMIEGVNDSKKISEKKREMLYDLITEQAISYNVGIVDQNEIDRVNILNATKAGLTESIKGLNVKPDIILVDALKGIDTCGIPFNSIIKGDAKSYSIAAASIIAKVTRDRIMRQWDELYPIYGFEKHKGYGTAAHINAIKEHGICPLHRRSFVKNFLQ